MQTNDINAVMQNIINAKKAGKNPQAFMQMIMQQNPNAQQAIARLQNMAQGRNPQEFIMQLARQNGVNEQNLQELRQLFGNR